MPVKRQYGSLTGGTGDVNPQTYVLQGALAAGGTSFSFPLPIPKYPGSNNRAIVLELLGVDWNFTDPPVPSSVNGDGFSSDFAVTTNASTPASANDVLSDPRALSYFRRSTYTLNATAVGFSLYSPNLGEYDDLTDNAGHGLLVGTDNIYVRGFTAIAGGYFLGGTVVAQLKYRFKEVSLTEYIGIVQSQQ